MPVPVSVSPSTVINAVDIVWPYGSASRLGAGDALDATGLRGGVAVALLSAAVGAGVNTYAIDARGQLYAHFDSDGAGAVVSRSLDYFRIYAPLYSTGLPAGYRNPDWCRVWRVQVGLRCAAVGAAVWSFFGLLPEAAAAPGLPSGTAPFFGLRGNGAGSWEFVSRNAAGAAVQESVALGILQTAFVIWDFVVVSATATAAAYFNLYANGALILTRSWAAGTLLPTYASVANSSHFLVGVGATDAGVACALQLGMMRCTAGRFMPDGSEV